MALKASTSDWFPIYVSLWIEKTGWATYLRGHDLRQVARLLEPSALNESGLLALHKAFDALIDAAR